MNADRVTLLMVDTGHPEGPDQAARTILHCAPMLPWGGIRLGVWMLPEKPLPASVAVSVVPYFTSSEFAEDAHQDWHLTHYQEFFAEGTSHILFMHHDGFILHPELWNDDWLEWDVVAAPHPAGHVKSGCYLCRTSCDDPRHCRVGGCGFCLKSRAFCLATADLYRRGIKRFGCSDTWECRYMRARLEREYGIRYAPAEAAAKFAIEFYGDEWVNWPEGFGFHGGNRRA